MTYALKIRRSTKGAGERDLMKSDPLTAAQLAPHEEMTHSFINKHFRKEWKILEAGCGLGRWMIFLSENDYVMSGIDISESSIESLRKLKPDIDLTVGDIKKMPYDDDEFDAVLSDGVVEHDRNGPNEMLSEMYRVLKPGGVMLIIVPVENWTRAIIHRPLCAIRYLLLRITGKKLEFEEYRFSADEFARILTKSGWKIIEYSWVELVKPDYSYALWVDWGNFFREKKSSEPFKLNKQGVAVKKIFWKLSPWTIAEGIIFAVRKI
jgi:ubiquinone/menaquinone biosynthesis C-methylase UbiE